ASGALRSALAHDLPHEELDAAELRQRFPAFAVRDDTVAVWEPRAGILNPDACISAHIRLAVHLGATVRTGERVTGWSGGGDGANGIDVTTEGGEYRGAKLVLAAGAWLAPLVPELRLPLTIQRAVLYWFRPAGDAGDTDQLGPDRFPIFIWEYEPGRIWYGFPDTGDGVKVALHHQGETTSPETIRRTVSDDEIAHMRSLVREYIPAADGPLLETAVCMYTNTPDLHFLIDRHPRSERAVLVSPCSGHGFKFASAIGEQVAALVLDGKPSLDLSAFALSRAALGHG
ncbi:MAG: N-methyl-L-tryptophan oxidase, partial [Gemmatimonadaceae bacterium]